MGRILRVFCGSRRICLGGGLEPGLALDAGRQHSRPDKVGTESLFAPNTHWPPMRPYARPDCVLVGHPEGTPARVSVLVSVRFGIPCVLLRTDASFLTAIALCLQRNASWCA